MQLLRFLWFATSGYLLSIPLFLSYTNGSSIYNGHPLYPSLLLLTFVVGSTIVYFQSFREKESNSMEFKRGWKSTLVFNIGSALVALLLIASTSFLLWLNPYSATSKALEALQPTHNVTVTFGWYDITLSPTSIPRAGFVLYPGARVDSRAYASILRPIVDQGFLVVIVKAPLGIAWWNIKQSKQIIERLDGIQRWVIGGHSLGGASAAACAGKYPEKISSLVLWASYPDDKTNPKNSSIPVYSIFGSEDAIVTPEKVRLNSVYLPNTTHYIEIKGANHAYFGDYGLQPHDGKPTINEEIAQRMIVKSTLPSLE